MITCYLGLGSNIGECEQQLRRAVNLLADHPDIYVRKVSSIYVTAPLGYTQQSDFLNIVVQIETILPPTVLLAACQAIERQLNRIRKFRWGPRTIDVDILLYDDQHITTQELSIPHPLIDQRLFVLVPMAEIVPGLSWDGKTVGERIAAVGGQKIQVYKRW